MMRKKVRSRPKDDGDVHVYPLYGREHVTSRECWCGPEQDTEEPRLWVHKDSH